LRNRGHSCAAFLPFSKLRKSLAEIFTFFYGHFAFAGARPVIQVTQSERLDGMMRSHKLLLKRFRCDINPIGDFAAVLDGSTFYPVLLPKTGLRAATWRRPR
jgi:hypothetical protein